MAHGKSTVIGQEPSSLWFRPWGLCGPDSLIPGGVFQASHPLIRGCLLGEGGFRKGIWLTQRMIFRVGEEEPCEDEKRARIGDPKVPGGGEEAQREGREFSRPLVQTKQH